MLSMGDARVSIGCCQETSSNADRIGSPSKYRRRECCRTGSSSLCQLCLTQKYQSEPWSRNLDYTGSIIACHGFDIFRPTKSTVGAEHIPESLDAINIHCLGRCKSPPVQPM